MASDDQAAYDQAVAARAANVDEVWRWAAPVLTQPERENLARQLERFVAATEQMGQDAKERFRRDAEQLRIARELAARYVPPDSSTQTAVDQETPHPWHEFLGAVEGMLPHFPPDENSVLGKALSQYKDFGTPPFPPEEGSALDRVGQALKAPLHQPDVLGSPYPHIKTPTLRVPQFRTLPGYEEFGPINVGRTVLGRVGPLAVVAEQLGRRMRGEPAIPPLTPEADKAWQGFRRALAKFAKAMGIDVNESDPSSSDYLGGADST